MTPQYSVLIHVHGETWEEAQQETERALKMVKAEGPCVGAFQEGKASVFLTVNRSLTNWMGDSFRSFRKLVARGLRRERNDA